MTLVEPRDKILISGCSASVPGTIIFRPHKFDYDITKTYPEIQNFRSFKHFFFEWNIICRYIIEISFFALKPTLILFRPFPTYFNCKICNTKKMDCLTSSELEKILLIFARGQFCRYKSAKQKVFNNFRIRSAMSSFRRLVLAQAPLWPDCPIIVQQQLHMCTFFI